MSSDSTRRLIRQLSEDVPPVRRVAPLWASFGGVVAVAALAGVVFLALQGVRAEGALLWSRERAAAGLLGGLLAAGLLGSLACLAEGVPGRERVASVCEGVALAGLAWAAGTGAALWWGAEGTASVPLAADRMCLRNAIAVGLAPVAGLVVALLLGWVGRPGRAAVGALAAGAALGGVVVHFSCGITAARHLLVGHVAPPFLLVLVAAVPLALWLRHRAR